MCRLRLAAIFSDHMVLQMGKEAAVFGEGETGNRVRVTLGSYEASAVVEKGRFLAKLPAMSYGGPYVMTVSDGRETVSFEDVYVGEVFLAGGQSNMELELQNCEDGFEEMLAADCEAIRMYNVLKTPVLDEEALVQERERQWMVCKPGAFAEVSAAAYYSAKRIWQELKAAVGVIDCYQGGTSITCWMGRDILGSFPYGVQYLSDYDNKVGQKTEEEYDREYAIFRNGVDGWNESAQKLRKETPSITDGEIIERLGACPWNPPVGSKSLFRPCGLYETMLSRVVPYTVRAVWYYQGEEDTVRAGQYEEMLGKLIKQWRGDYEEKDLPFVIVQLPMFIEKGAEDDRQWAKLRSAQYQVCQKTDNVWMVCLIDCGEFNNIHPRDKKTPGTRLGLKTLESIFRKEVKGSSNYAKSVEREGNALVVSFEKEEKLVVWGTSILYFELAGDDRIYQKAEAEITQETKIQVTSDKVKEPHYVRYAWVNYGKVSLFSETGLPVAPFELEC